MSSAANIEFQCLSFEQLSNQQLYDLLKLRQDVFIVEQECIYADLDGEDINHLHLLMIIDGVVAGYLRIIPAEFHSSGCVAIGRVVISMPFRRQGLALKIMQWALDYCEENFAGQLIYLSAQEYLIDFYKSLGFTVVSEIYLEDGLPHLGMKKLPRIIP